MVKKLKAPSAPSKSVATKQSKTQKRSLCSWFMSPREHLDRLSYIAISLNLLLHAIIAGIGLHYFHKKIMMAWTITGQMVPLKLILSPAERIVLTVFGIYMLWIIVMSVFTIIKRSRKLGLAGWTMLFSFPFGLHTLSLSGFFLPDSDEKMALDLRMNWFKKLVNWVAYSTPGQMLSGILIMLSSWIAAPIIFVFDFLFFWLPASLFGREKVSKSFKNYAPVIAVFNILMIILLVIAIALVYRAYLNMTPGSELTVSETISATVTK